MKAISRDKHQDHELDTRCRLIPSIEVRSARLLLPQSGIGMCMVGRRHFWVCLTSYRTNIGAVDTSTKPASEIKSWFLLENACSFICGC
jgi:hypothetical protein